jgi:hypothetical protein
MTMKKPATGILAEFAEHLKADGYSAGSVDIYTRTAREFLKHVGNRPIDRISEAETRRFFNRFTNKHTHRDRATQVSAFLKFAMRGLPAVVNARGAESPRAPTKKELALKAKWTLDRLISEKERADDLIALLARKLIDHYVYFENRLKGEPDDFDEIARFVAESRDLIERNLPLFMSMSAQGRNVHSRIDERVQYDRYRMDSTV